MMQSHVERVEERHCVEKKRHEARLCDCVCILYGRGLTISKQKSWESNL